MEEVQEDSCTGLLRRASLYSFLNQPINDIYVQRNNKLVWDETVRIMVDLFENEWGNKEEIPVDHCVELTLPV